MDNIQFIKKYSTDCVHVDAHFPSYCIDVKDACASCQLLISKPFKYHTPLHVGFVLTLKLSYHNNTVRKLLSLILFVAYYNEIGSNYISTSAEFWLFIEKVGLQF